MHLIDGATDAGGFLAKGESVLVPHDFRGDLPGDVLELDSMNTKTHRFIHRLSDHERAQRSMLENAAAAHLGR